MQASLALVVGFINQLASDQRRLLAISFLADFETKLHKDIA